MSLQGPILIVANKPDSGLAQAFTDAGAFPIVEASWAGAPTAAAEVKPAAILLSEPEAADLAAAAALARYAAEAVPFLPMVIRVRDNVATPLPDALAIADDASAEQLIARVSSALRLRTLHSTVLGRAKALKDERNIVAEMPAADPLDDAIVLLIGRGRHHPTLSVAVGERMGVMGALSIDQGAACLKAREIDGIIIGDGLAAGSVEAFIAVLSEDTRFRDLPVAVLGAGADAAKLPNFVRARDPLVLLQRAVPLIRMRTLETALKRLLQSIEGKGMIDARTGLFNVDAFGQALALSIDDAEARGTRLSLARFSFDNPLDRRTSMDAARLVSRLVRDADFACRQDDGSILFVFGDTELRDAHVVARRLASVLKHTMLRADRERPGVSPSVTLATLKSSDTMHTLLARVAPRPVAAA
jgi:GGDEF domain-containing protein